MNPLPWLLLSGMLASGFPDSTLTLTAAAERALVVYPGIQAAAADVAGADATRREATGAWWPHLTAQGSLTRFQKPMIVAPIHALDATQLNFDRTLVQGDLRATWTVFDGGARGATIRGAAAAADGSRAGEAATAADLLADVARRFLGARTADAVLAAQDDGVRALRAERARVTLRVETGDAARVELLRVEAALAEAEAARVRAAADRESARRGLARALELPALATAPLADARPRAQPTPVRDTLLARLEEQSPVLRQARDRLAEAGAGRRRASAAWWPRLDVQGGVIAYGDGGWGFTSEWQVGARVSYPIFAGGERSAAVARASARETAAAEQVRLLRLRLADALDAAVAARAGAIARVEALEAATGHLAEVVRVEALALEAGAGVEAEFLRAEADARRARAQLAEARAARLLADIELARVTGDLTIEWLRTHVEIMP